MNMWAQFIQPGKTPDQLLGEILGMRRGEPDTIKTVWMEHARRDKRAQEIHQLTRQHAIPLQRVERIELDQMVNGARHQGIVAEARLQPALNEAALTTLLAGLEAPPFLLILDGVQDPHNLGACLRTADAAGVHAVIAPRDKACGLTSTVRKVACGAAETVPFVQVTNLARTLKALQQAGIWIIGTDLDATASLYDSDLTGPVALVLGAEGKGLRLDFSLDVRTLERCAEGLWFPSAGSLTSVQHDLTNTYKATKITLNQGLKDEDFRIAFPAGTKVSDETTGARYTVEASQDEPAVEPGSESDANAVTDTRKRSGDPGSPEPDSPPAVATPTIYIVIGVAIVAALALFLMRKGLRS